MPTTTRSQSGYRVVIRDPRTGESFSLTVCGVSSLKRLALQVEHDLNHHWNTTKLNDRRHKRR